jgi:hypothetical protein
MVPAGTGYAGLAFESVLNRLFIFAGWQRTNISQPSNELWFFDLGAKTWIRPSVNSAIPSVRYFPAMVFVPQQKLIYIAGGCNSLTGTVSCANGGLSDVYVLNADPANNGL